MNEEQKKKVASAIDAHELALEILKDDFLMESIFEGYEQIRRGERGVRLADIEQKPKRARRSPA
jgi:hypothetical protein